MSRTLYAAGAALILATMRISAHHAFAAEYDENKLVTVSGTVTAIKWTNPHAWLYVDEKDERKQFTSWSFEMGSPNGLLHRGWTRTDLKKGDQVTVDGYRAKTAARWPTPAPLPFRTAGNNSGDSKPPRAHAPSRRAFFGKSDPL
jgi:hypothetical protein